MLRSIAYGEADRIVTLLTESRGKVSLIAAALVIVALAALAYNGMKSKEGPAGKASSVDVPRAPQPEVSVEPISAAEAQRRAQRSTLEAEQAAERGASY